MCKSDMKLFPGDASRNQYECAKWLIMTLNYVQCLMIMNDTKLCAVHNDNDMNSNLVKTEKHLIFVTYLYFCWCMSSARALRWRARAFVGVSSFVCLRVSPRAAQHPARTRRESPTSHRHGGVSPRRLRLALFSSPHPVVIPAQYTA